MQLTHKMTLKTLNNRKLTVQRKLGGGGQGEVYLVQEGGKSYALKWYFDHQSTELQERSIRELVQQGLPGRHLEGSKRFVWPLDFVKPQGSKRFGYLMDVIDMSTYRELGVQMRTGRQLPLPVCAEIGYQLANSFRTLHQAGLCYCDISRGNMLFNPSTGDVLICDNDNVGVDSQATSQVLGTWEYMAPEVILRQTEPSTKTDLYSLAVLLFQLWNWHHPMHGMKEYNVRSLDLHAKKMLYGSDPVFIFDPKNRSNSVPSDPEYAAVQTLWKLCPKILQDLFVRSFTDGIRSPGRRVTEGEWQRAFLQLRECMLKCPKCGAYLLWETGDGREKKCWNCVNTHYVSGYLRVDTKSGMFPLPLMSSMKLYDYHFDPMNGRGLSPKLIGMLVENPNQKGKWGVRNQTRETWSLQPANGPTMDVPPGKAAPLLRDATFFVSGKTVKIVPYV